MADIFLSYNEKDRERVRSLAQTLETAGWSVWWDRRVPAGVTWRSLLEQELQDMRCMLVLWSTHSVKSEWVCEEATEGRLLGRLIPVFIDRVRPPAGFREVQAADLIGWDGSPGFPGLQQLLQDIAHKLGTPAPQPIPQPSPVPPMKPWLWGGAASLLVLAPVGYFGATALAHRQTVAESPVVTAPTAISAAPSAATPEPSASATPTLLPPPTPVAVVSPPVVKKRDPANPRCTALLERQAMGEALSSQSQLFVQQECQK
nr:toll/interleukin-1 receptor domain-containing protein [uncultured Albidiferax sp.]